MNQIDNCVFMKQYMVIRQIVTKVYDEAKKYFINTTHEIDCFLNHDTLSQMICAETVKWMKEQGYYK